MGEYVWTMISVGGKAKRETLDKLQEIGNSYFQEEDIKDALQHGHYVTFQGERNFGNADETERFCQENGLSYVLSWSAQPGVFHSGVKAWKPGMDEPKEFSADDDGRPSMCSVDLRAAMARGQTLVEIIEELEAVQHNSLPALELIEA